MRLFFVKAEGVHTQVGVAVGRKVAKSVGRSRGKRVLRESLRKAGRLKPTGTDASDDAGGD